MNVRTVSLAVGAAAVALLLPTLQTGAFAGDGDDKKVKPPVAEPSAAPACAVAADPAASTGEAKGSVLETATLENDPLTYPTTVGYYVEKKAYTQSSAFRASIAYTPPAAGGCGSISLLTFPVTAAGEFLAAVQTTTVPLSGDATSVVINSLAAGLPSDSLSNSAGLCVGTQVEVRDANGGLVQRFPAAGPQEFCPVPGGRVYAG